MAGQTPSAADRSPNARPRRGNARERDAEADAFLTLVRPGGLRILLALERRPMDARSLAAYLGVPDEQIHVVRFAIRTMIRSGLVERVGTEQNAQNKPVPVLGTCHKGWRTLATTLRRIERRTY